MARDELNDPLGMDLDSERSQAREIPYRALAWSGCAMLAASLLAFTWATSDGSGGEPFAVAAIVAPKKSESAAVVPQLAAMAPDITGTIQASRELSAIESIEAQSGVKIIRQGGGSAPAAQIIQVQQALGIHLAPAPDKRLVEKSRFGPLPKTGGDGSTARDIYARPLITGGTLKASAPRIAIMLGAMGLAAGATQEASDKLPGAVTLAFAPYGGDLERQVAHAREQGHEVLLQAPMEPFDSAQNDPGPHTLHIDATPGQNLDDLHWVMGRASGYVGISGFLGARFTADRAGLAPVLADIGGRGLLYVDDGASPQSLAQPLAQQLGLAFAKADVVIDADPKPESIAGALLALEAIARRNGSALGVASALPASIEQVNRFARALEARGIALVPVSALATRSPQPTAQRQ